ncbi:copper resistance CopC family protein [Nesterenkonia suensis]
MNTATITADPSATGGVTTDPRRRFVRLAAAAGGAALGLTALTPAPAWAHDELLSATPEAGEVLTESPEEITLQFTGDGLTVGETITNEIQVTDEDGQSWETETVVDGASLSTGLDGELPDGEYEVVYRVVYSDGHDEEDSYSFEVDLPQEAAVEDDAENQADAADDDAAADAADAADAAEAEAAGGAEAENTEADPAAETDLATAEGQFPAWAAVLFGLGGLLIVILAVMLMRKKMTQVEEWKQAPRQPRDTAGETGTDGSGTDGSGPDRPRDHE